MAALQLQQQFPFVDQPTIQNILNNECNGDVNKAIPMLQKINQFNQAMNQPPSQQIPLTANATPQFSEGTATRAQPQTVQVVQVVQQPMQIANNNNYIAAIKQRHPGWNLNLGPSTSCCHRSCDAVNCPCCANCCTSCYLIPDKYSNGLYDMDLKVKNVAFILLVAMTIYGEVSMFILGSAYHGCYLPFAGLLFMGIGSVLFFVSKGQKDGSTVNKIIAICYGLGGLLYFVGYIIYTALLEDYDVCAEGGSVCDCEYTISYRSSYYYGDTCWCEDDQSYGDDVCQIDWYWSDWSRGQFDFTVFQPYYAARGIFIAYHCFMMVAHFFSTETKCFKDRLILIRIDSFVFGVIYLFLVCSLTIPDYIWIFALSGCLHFFAGIIVLVNMCIANPVTNNGGCNEFAVNGIMLFIFYAVEIILLLSFALDFAIHEDLIVEPKLIDMNWFFWAFGPIVFGSFQFWILLRAMHPVFVSCCCSKIQRDLVEI